MITVDTLAQANPKAVLQRRRPDGRWDVYFDGDELPTDFTPVEVTPAPTVTPWQIRMALNALGLRAAVESAVAGSDQNTKDAWQYATEFRRDHPLVQAIGAVLGKTSEEMDAVFELALNNGVPTDNPLTQADEGALSFWQQRFAGLSNWFAALFPR